MVPLEVVTSHPTSAPGIGRRPTTAAAGLVGPLLQQLMQSQARIAVVPLQDWLGLDTDARMNMPSTASGNWAWRLSGDELTTELAARIAAQGEASGRD